MRTLAIALLLLVALAAPAAAQAATPAQANRQVSACMKARGAIRVVPQSGHEGIAFFARPFNPAGRWVSWAWVTQTDTNQVVGVNAASGRLTRLQRRAVNRCLRPFHGHL
jgi:hypothetical protein